ncbi:hypothetical protein Ciccas_005402 [Cichlidogyrus casuarinus]|uniref:Uncharacterized protein n=1 Tax=Cichlidogyrus casuarinus TaxID=1844966 RepID=A0ABD2Q9Q3_9PLAT
MGEEESVVRKRSTVSWASIVDEDERPCSREEDSISVLSELIRIRRSSINEQRDIIKATNVLEFFSLSTGIHGLAKVKSHCLY